MNLYQRGKRGIWWLRATTDGGQVRCSLNTDNRDLALQRARAILTINPEYGSPKSLTDCVRAYLLSLRGVLAPASIRMAESLSDQLLAFFDPLAPLGDITPERIQEYRRHRLAAGLKASTVNQEVGLLYRIAKHAKVDIDRVKQLRETQSPGRALSPPERDALLGHAVTEGQLGELWAIVTLALHTGMRIHELMNLTWNDLTYEPPRKPSEIWVKKSKTEAGVRVIPVNKYASVALGILYNITGEKGLQARIISYQDFSRAWRNLTVKATLPGLRFHDLRHTFITDLYEKGVPEDVIRDLVGHVDPRVTRQYAHSRSEARRKAVEAL